jgi:3-hydroxymyristoyl/3-hydroxydecanoyl-(acyl carrier protein) dehydratase
VFSQSPKITPDQAIADYHVSGSAPFVLGHYPKDAIFPGVMSLHLMKRLSDQFFEYLTDTPTNVIHLKRITYLGIIRPGDVLRICSRAKKQTQNRLHIESFIEVHGVVMSKSTFLYELYTTRR